MTFWTDERETELRAHFAAGLSGGQIAFRMGCISRNVIIGKLHRLGLNRGYRPGPRTPRRPRPPNPPGPVMFKVPATVPRQAPQSAADAPITAPPDPCSLLELTNERCRWPTSDDGPPFVFCGARGADLHDGRPYCATHARMAYRE